MTIYRPTTNAAYGTALTNPGSAYDNNTTTAATGSQGGTSNMGATYSGFASLTGVTALTVYLAGSITTDDLHDENGNIIGGSKATLQYSYDGGTSWQTIGSWSGSGGSLSDGTYAMSAVTNLPANLSSVQLRIFINGAAYTYYDDAAQRNITLRAVASINLKELYVDAVAGPVITVNAVSGPTSVYAGLSGVYSATVTNDSTNSCTWSIVSGGGSLSGAVNDGTSSRVTWTAPTASGGTAVLRCTSNKDTTKYSQITVSVPLVGVSLTIGPSRMRVGTSGYYQVTVTGHSDNRVQWSVPAGSLSSNPANGTTWTVPSTPGRYVISGYHVYDTSKTFSYTVDVDYCPPTTSTYGVADTNLVSATPTNLAYAYDNNTATYGEVSTSYIGAGVGNSYGYWDFYGILPVANIVKFTMTIYGYLYNCTVYYSVDNGGSWQGGWSQVGDYRTTPLVLTAAPGGSFDMSNVRIRIVVWSSGTLERDPDSGKNVLVTTDGYADVYEIFCTPTLRAYIANTDTANHGTSPAALYMPSQFSPLTGTMAGVGTTPVAIGSGVGAIQFFTGASGG
jgi:hypothetical protein